MKNSRDERLSEHLMNVDEEILRTHTKLTMLRSSGNISKRRTQRLRNRFI